MKKIIPDKLKQGDEIRIVAPSRSLSILNKKIVDLATNRLKELGFNVTFSKNSSNVCDLNYKCASIEDRASDLNEAFSDKNVKAILTVIGGYNVNQILDYIDYDIIKSNPKILCGYSDITALLNAIYTKTGLVTYYGPHFSSFGMEKGCEYTIEYFKKMFMSEDKVEILDSKEWSDDSWFSNQENRNFHINGGRKIYYDGDVSGRIIGGNLCTLNLLQGTEYMPELDNTILLLEDDDMAGKNFLQEFDRNLQSLLHCYKNKKLKGLIIGRAQVLSNMTIEKWESLIKTKKELQGIPVIFNMDFGHTTPICTIPIGGNVEIKNGRVFIED